LGRWLQDGRASVKPDHLISRVAHLVVAKNGCLPHENELMVVVQAYPYLFQI